MYNNRCMKYPSNQHKPLYRGLEDDLPRKNGRFLGGMAMFDACNPLWNPYPGAAWRSSTSWFITSWELGLRGLRIKNLLKPPMGWSHQLSFMKTFFFATQRVHPKVWCVWISVPSGDNQEFANWKPLKPWKPWPRTSEKGFMFRTEKCWVSIANS